MPSLGLPHRCTHAPALAPSWSSTTASACSHHPTTPCLLLRTSWRRLRPPSSRRTVAGHRVGGRPTRPQRRPWEPRPHCDLLRPSADTCDPRPPPTRHTAMATTRAVPPSPPSCLAGLHPRWEPAEALHHDPAATTAKPCSTKPATAAPCALRRASPRRSMPPRARHAAEAPRPRRRSPWLGRAEQRRRDAGLASPGPCTPAPSCTTRTALTPSASGPTPQPRRAGTSVPSSKLPTSSTLAI